MRKSKVIFWVPEMDAFLTGRIVIGISIQMSLWAKAFLDDGWSVYCPSLYSSHTSHGIHFIRIPLVKWINLLISPFVIIYVFLKARPDVVICNGATRDLFLVALCSRLFGTKVIEIFASDTDVEPERELIASHLDRRLYRCGLRMTDRFVVQNVSQKNNLATRYGKQSIIIPSVWDIAPKKKEGPDSVRDEILWVAFFRSLKRPEWFLDIAEAMPDHRFVMIGGAIEAELYERCKSRASKMPNVEFVGKLSLEQTNERFEKAKLLICTSEVEGFPNTFLQAWANNVPVISTCDPSNVINNRKLGINAGSKEEIVTAIKFLDSPERYRELQANIEAYFYENHHVSGRYLFLKREFEL